MLPPEPSVASDAQGIPLWHGDRNLVWHPAEMFDDGREPTHVAHALDAASREARREAVIRALEDCGIFSRALIEETVADAVLKALGLGGDDA